MNIVCDYASLIAPISYVPTVFGDNTMMTLEAIEAEIQKLPSQELAKLRRWFDNFFADTWDTKIEADAALGKFDNFAKEALAEYEAGKAIEI